MGAWPTKTDTDPDSTVPNSQTKTPEKKTRQSMAPETNNNVPIASFDVADSAAAISQTPMAKVWVLLTPKVLKVIIVVLASAVIASISIVIIIVVTHVYSAAEKPIVIITSPIPPSSSTTTTPAVPPTSTANASTTTTTAATTTRSSSSPSTSTSTAAATTTPAVNETSSSPNSSTSATSVVTTPSSTVSTPIASVNTTAAQECETKEEFTCRSGECIPWKQLCDSLPHCKDGSDEGFDCVCSADQWQCSSGQCVSLTARCDQSYDCLDSSDEVLCPDCSGFQCDTGLCLWDGNYGRCNGVFECTDLSDEMACAPRASTVLCGNSVRIPQAQWCDGLDQCGDNSDESNCTRVCARTRQFGCPDGHCIQRLWVCDGYNDCLDGADESNCGTCLPTEFMCEDYRCVGEEAVCDGKWDCRTGEDERHCFSAQDDRQGLLWVRYKGQDYAVCSDHWSTDLAVQICTDFDQLQLSGWTETAVPRTVTLLMAFKAASSQPQTTNLLLRNSCTSGKVINISCQKQDCGERKVPFLQSFVAGGQLASPGKWPWVVSLMYLGSAICGGTLVNERWVVTAAHCILQAARDKDFDLTLTPYNFDVILGSTHKRGQTRTGTPFRIRADSVLLHPDLKQSGPSGVWDWDVALVRLSVPVTLTPHVQPLCLPSQGQSIERSALCYVAGWGLMNTQQDLPPEDLRDARMRLWSHSRCAKNTVPGETTVNTNSTLCAGFPFGRPAPCQGDSGGPLMCLSPSGRWMLGGVMSRGSSLCGLSQPTLRATRFTRAASVAQWIQQTTKL